MGAPGDELVDVVDEADNVVGTVTRAEMRTRDVRHRSVGIVITASDNRLLVHRRAESKDVWPGRWDLAVGGVVGADEGYQPAAERELAEEVGIVGVEVCELGRGSFDDDAVSTIVRWFGCVYDGPISFPDGEVAEARWVEWPEFAALLATEIWCPDSITLGLSIVLARLGMATLHNP